MIAMLVDVHMEEVELADRAVEAGQGCSSAVAVVVEVELLVL